MDTINLNRPYKILSRNYKRYARHYDIPAGECLIIPTRKFGDQIRCQVIWKDAHGELQRRDDLMFSSSNIEPIDEIRDYPVFLLWENYCGSAQTDNG